ncbi:unnamed protein product [Zymoseptoria tritici ST99CH_1A5]|uniref:Uncharacterized protein n=1 Tax=Zymoseptoria tritici ST99CH_1A5 TaxID=1276529 RepID=A0A1Y6M2P3_ZYMTR|nr:unnamed protein product [Zymoseptoria tritici ST99CH_1A5]
MPPMATLPPDREDNSASRKIKYQHQEDDVPVVANLIPLDRTDKNVQEELSERDTMSGLREVSRKTTFEPAEHLRQNSLSTLAMKLRALEKTKDEKTKDKKNQGRAVCTQTFNIETSAPKSNTRTTKAVVRRSIAFFDAAQS